MKQRSTEAGQDPTLQFAFSTNAGLDVLINSKSIRRGCQRLRKIKSISGHHLLPDFFKNPHVSSVSLGEKSLHTNDGKVSQWHKKYSVLLHTDCWNSTRCVLRGSKAPLFPMWSSKLMILWARRPLWRGKTCLILLSFFTSARLAVPFLRKATTPLVLYIWVPGPLLLGSSQTQPIQLPLFQTQEDFFLLFSESNPWTNKSNKTSKEKKEQTTIAPCFLPASIRSQEG